MDWIIFNETVDQCFYKIDKQHLSTEKSNGLRKALDIIKNIDCNDYPKPFILLCSGGVDSQAMAYAWHLSGIDHKIILYQYVDKNNLVYNDHDLNTFHDFARQFNIKYTTKDINYFDFLENDLLNYAKKFNCASPQITLMIKMIEQISYGTILLSGNFIQKIFNIIPFDYDILALYRFSKTCSHFKVIPFFFLYDINLAYGFNTPPYDKHDIRFLNSYKAKCDIYRYNGFPIISQETKLSGFEKIKDYFDSKHELITYKDRLRFLNKPSKRIFDIKYRYMLREQIGKEPEFKIIIE